MATADSQIVVANHHVGVNHATQLVSSKHYPVVCIADSAGNVMGTAGFTGVFSLAALSLRVDDASATVTYIGKADPGAAEGSAVWQIKRITVTGTVTDIKFADGNFGFDNVWTDRATIIVYS